ncbi:breast carcinoma-amplified sequence 3 homolog [Nilaparvata lugens]|uniref:breast carcinoma-amplified sequence 3 homolog n=1 Tax=Nilaparvata lugens TaxID=108931 RepID=UPI00193E0B61|nr:breast carcinoma-amplified sequence 3 homolog [Nilaparvata lugens]
MTTSAALPPGLLQTGSGGQYGGVGGGGGGGVGGSGGGVMTSQQRKSDSSIYVMSAPSGALLQYDLEPRHIAGLSKDRVSDDTAIELLVDAKAEWLVMWPPLFNPVQPPLAASSPLLQGANCPLLQGGSNRPHNHAKPNPHHDEHWLSQVLDQTSPSN